MQVVPTMADYFVPSLINPPTEDPGLYLTISCEKDAVLVDCGSNHRLSVKALQKVSHIFISHTHIDHFVGLDNVLRTNVHLSKTLHIYGPPGITAHVHHKILGYTWNLLLEEALEVKVYELEPEQRRETLISYKDAFQNSCLLTVTRVHDNVVYESSDFHVCCAWLEHKIVCLGYSFVVYPNWRVDKEKLAAFGHSPGPWVKELKSLAEGVATAKDAFIKVGDKEYLVSELKERLLTQNKGQKIAYVTDTLYTPQTEAAVIGLAQGADLFFCETHFAEQEAQKAKEAYHLTARQAGVLARQANVKRVIGFHYSPRYFYGKQWILEKELQEAFQTKEANNV